MRVLVLTNNPQCNQTHRHQVFQVFQHQTPVPRQPSHGWSVSSLCLGGLSHLQISPFGPQPSWCLLGCINDVQSLDPEQFHGLVQWGTSMPCFTCKLLLLGKKPLPSGLLREWSILAGPPTASVSLILAPYQVWGLSRLWCLPRSTFCQSQVAARRPTAGSMCCRDFSLALTKAIEHFWFALCTQTLPLHTNHTAGAGFHHPCPDLLLAQLAASHPLFHIEVLRYCQDLPDLLKLQPRSFVWSTEYYPMTKVTLRFFVFCFFLVS